MGLFCNRYPFQYQSKYVDFAKGRDGGLEFCENIVILLRPPFGISWNLYSARGAPFDIIGITPTLQWISSNISIFCRGHRLESHGTYMYFATAHLWNLIGNLCIWKGPHWNFFENIGIQKGHPLELHWTFACFVKGAPWNYIRHTSDLERVPLGIALNAFWSS